MPRYKLRTLLILLAVLPPLIWFGWTKYEAWKAAQERRAAIKREQERYRQAIDLAQAQWARRIRAAQQELEASSHETRSTLERDQPPVTVPDEPRE